MKTQALIQHLEDIIERGADEKYGLLAAVSKEHGTIITVDEDGTPNSQGDRVLTLPSRFRGVGSIYSDFNHILSGTTTTPDEFNIIPVAEALEWLRSIRED